MPIINGTERAFPVLPSTDLRNYAHVVGTAGPPDDAATQLLDRGTIRLDQGASQACTMYSGGNAWKASVATGAPTNDMCLLWYYHALTLDEFPGEDPSTGTTASAEMKELRFQKLIKAWSWARTPEEVIDQVMLGRPLSWPAVWTRGMANPRKGIMSLSGSELGGHMSTIVGWVGPWQLVVIENSWGAGWGNDGLGYLSWDNFVRKFEEWPEAAVPLF